MPVPDTYQPNDTKPESLHLRAADYKLDTQWTLTITDVNLETMPARDDKGERKRLILSFGRSKGLVLNATNQAFLEVRLGMHPNAWVGAQIDLHRTTTRSGPTRAGIPISRPAGPMPHRPIPQRHPSDENPPVAACHEHGHRGVRRPPHDRSLSEHRGNDEIDRGRTR